MSHARTPGRARWIGLVVQRLPPTQVMGLTSLVVPIGVVLPGLNIRVRCGETAREPAQSQ